MAPRAARSSRTLALGGAHVGGREHPERAGAALEELAHAVAHQAPARPLEEGDQEVDAVGRGELALDLEADGAVARAVDEQVAGGQGDGGPRRRGGGAEAGGGGIDQGEELAGRWSHRVVGEDGRIGQAGAQELDEVVDEGELLLGLAAAEEGCEQVADEAGEHLRGLGAVEGGDLVAPAAAAELVEHGREPPRDELLIEAGGA